MSKKLGTLVLIISASGDGTARYKVRIPMFALEGEEGCWFGDEEVECLQHSWESIYVECVYVEDVNE